MPVHRNDCYLGYTKRNLTPSIEALVTLTAYYDSTRECAMIYFCIKPWILRYLSSNIQKPHWHETTNPCGGHLMLLDLEIIDKQHRHCGGLMCESWTEFSDRGYADTG